MSLENFFGKMILGDQSGLKQVLELKQEYRNMKNDAANALNILEPIIMDIAKSNDCSFTIENDEISFKNRLTKFLTLETPKGDYDVREFKNVGRIKLGQVMRCFKDSKYDAKIRYLNEYALCISIGDIKFNISYSNGSNFMIVGDPDYNVMRENGILTLDVGYKEMCISEKELYLIFQGRILLLWSCHLNKEYMTKKVCSNNRCSFQFVQQINNYLVARLDNDPSVNVFELGKEACNALNDAEYIYKQIIKFERMIDKFNKNEHKKIYEEIIKVNGIESEESKAIARVVSRGL